MAALKGVQHIFFDLDDTLWDYKVNSERVLRELYIEFDLPSKLHTETETFLEQYHRINQRFWLLYGRGELDKDKLRKNRFKDIFAYFGYYNDEDNSRITSAYQDRAPKGTSLKPGCLEVLNYLKPKYQLHLLTNGFSDVQFIKLNSSGLQNYFSQVIISEEHQLRKPEPEVFSLAEKLSQAKSEHCLMIGDHLENDVLGALNAGWQAIHLDNENKKLHQGYRITTLKELPGLI